MRKFSIPYNFSSDYIIELNKRKNLYNSIEYIYMPCFYKDGFNSRFNSFLNDTYPKTWEKYKEHIDKLIKELPIAIAFQFGTTIEIIDKYYQLGIRRFIISNDNLAKAIKSKYSDIILTLSIIRQITQKELEDETITDLYDIITLPFNYCRQLQELEKLKSHKYSIIVNSHCLYNCNRCLEHWQLNAETLDEYLIKEAKIRDNYCLVYTETRAFIKPSDLVYFDKYIYLYKLVDRLDSTQDIMDYLDNYIMNINNPFRKESWYRL